MTLLIRPVFGASLLALAGCGAVALPPINTSDPVGQLGNNGLPTADGTQVLADAEGVEMRIVLVRATADYDSDFLGILVSEETVEFGEGYLTGGPRNKVITLDGEPMTFVDGLATAEGQTFERFTYLEGTNAQVEGIYSYDGDGRTGFDTESVFLFGFETAEETLNLRDDTATFLGRFNGYGHVANGRRTIVGSEINASGTIAFMADFSTGMVDGALTGRAEYSEIIALEGGFEDAEIVGNGFASMLEMTCPDGATCESGSSLGAVFFDQYGSEIAGVIGFDETQSFGSGSSDTLRFVGAAGFSAMEEVVE